ncbi:arylsulfatase [Nitrogeniibacter aestuarii]|uniref:arylsulfatase n=1 Tax=Nitrogeniibacter aestuarii TaxID=2815343 RepID=UPI001D11F5B0|nr:arylsulfatase [Nitrogeniibacter aestuarii]
MTNTPRNPTRLARSLCLGLAALTGLCQVAIAQAAPQKRSNILIVVADDLGYSDIGRFGGEIATPNLDTLAQEGVTMTQFYASPFCSPTRAMLMSGSDNHLAGFGDMGELLVAEQRGKPGYEGHLNNRVVTMAEVLKGAGYRTAMTGKWHLGVPEEFSPAARGFEQSYAMVQGGASHFGDQLGVIAGNPDKTPMAVYRENGQQVNIPKDFYSSDFYTDKLIDYLETGKDTGKPFFAYLAYTAPHWPLQAPEVDIKKYEDRYKAGYEALRKERLERMRTLGIVGEQTAAYPGNPVWPKWDTLTPEQKRSEARRMAVYAAMVDRMDRNIGRMLDYLKRSGELDNTYIFFLSDNGADGNSVYDVARTREWIRKVMDNSTANLGLPGSFAEYGPGWAQVSATPFHLYKAYVYEGGITVPAIAWGPGMKQGAVKREVLRVTDIAPTVYQLAGARYPSTHEGHTVVPLEGKSMLPYLRGEADAVHGKDDAMGWELGGRKALRKGDWKIVYANPPWGSGQWELYNLADDRTELNDLAAAHPQKLGEMLAAWKDYVRKTGTLELPGLAERPGYSNSRNYYEDLEFEANLTPRTAR